ncbi:hypothetical protein QZH41_015283 [Actinostola sp. cb2023]|nr:hypothetical protein QZH41_015283 [Actinostola sp. cb2023]
MDSKEVAEVLLSDGNGLLPVNALVERLKAVCFIQATVTDNNRRQRLRRGTGFYTLISIADIDYHGIITNNHVLAEVKDAQMAEAVFGYDNVKQGKRVSLRPDLIFRTNMDLDYSFVGIQKEDIEALNLGISPIKFISEPKIGEDDEIFILQHPKGRPKEFSHDKILHVEPPFVYYKADTESGSSGAPVLWRLNLVAVHQKGSEELGYNKGVLCSEILSHLNTGKYTVPKMFSPSDSQGKEIDEDSIPTKRQKLQKTDVSSPSEDELECLAEHVIVIWKHLGRKLGLSNSKIEEISRDHINYQGIREKAFQMLLFWKESNINHSYLTLGKALNELGKCNLAQQYCKM